MVKYIIITALAITSMAGAASQITTKGLADSAVTNAKIAASTIDLTAKVTGVLPFANGGTGGGSYLAGSSAVVTPNASGNWINMSSGNTVTLTTGTWSLHASYLLSAAAAVGYGQVQCGYFGAQGTNTSTAPTALTSTGGVTVQAGASAPSIVPAFNGDNNTYTFPDVRVSISGSIPVYVVCKFMGTTAANARFSAFIYAERIN
jgi:hypothetical protein